MTQEVACEGTTLESTTFAAGTKTFVFLRRTGQGYEVRLELSDSRAEAVELGNATIGANGWAKLTFDDASAPLEHLRRWIAESHAALTARAPRKQAPAEQPTGRKTKAKKARSPRAPLGELAARVVEPRSAPHGAGRVVRRSATILV